MKFKKKSIIIACIALICVVLSGIFIMRKNSTFADDGEITYSSELAKEADVLAKSMADNMKDEMNKDYTTMAYGKDITVYDFLKVDDKNAYDKCTGKYAEKEDTYDEEEAAGQKKAMDEYISDLKDMEKNGNPLKTSEGIYVFSCYDAIESYKENMDPYDTAVYFIEDGASDFFVNMGDLSEEDAAIAISHMKSKEAVTISKQVSFRIPESNVFCTLLNSQINFDNSFKIIFSPNGDDISSYPEFEGISKDDCFSFLYDYMESEGIELDIVSHKPCTNNIGAREYEFDKEQAIIEKLKNQYPSLKINDSECSFNFRYNDETDGKYNIHYITATIHGSYGEFKDIDLYVTYWIGFE